ncbi:hypothetical protein NC651_021483 [Populus alba x Populus x berolinensis]|nr:hypothetical protein NC651_021483 [Populus alba x Populus x berolinensis]
MYTWVFICYLQLLPPVELTWMMVFIVKMAGTKQNQYKTAQGQWLMPPQPSMKQIMAIMAERDAAIHERNMALSEKKAAIAERDMAFLQRDSAIAERNNALLERDNAICNPAISRELLCKC